MSKREYEVAMFTLEALSFFEEARSFRESAIRLYQQNGEEKASAMIKSDERKKFVEGSEMIINRMDEYISFLDNKINLYELNNELAEEKDNKGGQVLKIKV